MTHLEFLEDTIKYYSENVKRRCTTVKACYYSPVSAKKEGISTGCAIGRFLKPEDAIKIDSHDPMSIHNVLSHGELKDLIPQWMQDLGTEFLKQVQGIHDNDFNWNEEGLTPLGWINVNQIKDRYCK
jgi:hypothetical protein